MDAVEAHQRRRTLYRTKESDIDFAMTSPDINNTSEHSASAEMFPIVVRINSLPSEPCEDTMDGSDPFKDRRFADYFLVLGASPSQKPLRQLNKSASTSQLPSNQSVRYPTVVLDRYPRNDREKAPLQQNVQNLCFPNGVETRFAIKPRPPRFFFFVLTDINGTRIYGAVATIDEKVPSTLFDDDQPSPSGNLLPVKKFTEKALCLISRFPFFSAFRDCLSQLCAILFNSPEPSHISFDAYVRSIIDAVPAPLLGGHTLRCHFSGPHAPATLLRLPSPRHLPLVDFTMRSVFDILGVQTVVKLFTAILLERRVLFLSRQATLLATVQESLLSLMYPLSWPHVYIPVLGTVLRDVLDAPTPFVMGALTTSDLALPPLPDVIMCDLDTGETVFPAPIPFTSLAKNLVRNLHEVLFPHLASVDILRLSSAENENTPEPYATDLLAPNKTARDVDTSIRFCFLEFFVHLMHDYRDFISYCRKYPYPIVWFNRDAFLSSRSGKDLDDFLTSFVESQPFNIFYESVTLQRPNLFDRACLLYNQLGDEGLKQLFAEMGVEKEADVFVDVPSPMPSEESFTYNCVPPLGISAEESIPCPPTALSDTLIPEEALPCFVSNEMLLPPVVGTDCCDVEETLIRSINSLLTSTLSDEQRAQLWVIVANRSNQQRFVYLLLDALGDFHFTKVNSESFKDLWGIVLHIATSTQSFDIPCSLLRVVSAIYCEDCNGYPKFLHDKLRDLEPWNKTEFWTYAFYYILREKRSQMPPHFNSTEDDWESMDRATRLSAAQMEMITILRTVGELAVSMKMFGMVESAIQQFIWSSCTKCDISPKHNDAILSLIGIMMNWYEKVHQKLIVEPPPGKKQEKGKKDKKSKKEKKEEKKTRGSKDFENESEEKEGDSDSAGEEEDNDNMGEKSASDVIIEDVIPVEKVSPVLEAEEDPQDSLRSASLRVSIPLNSPAVRMVYCKGVDVIVCGMENGELLFLDKSYSTEGRMQPFGSSVNLMATSVEGTLLLVTNYTDNKIYVINPSKRSVLATLTSHRDSVTRLVLFGLDKKAVSAAKDGTIRIWDLRSFREQSCITGAPRTIQSLTLYVSASATVATAGTSEGEILVYDLKDKTLLLRMRAHAGAVNGLAFMDSRHLLSCSDDGMAQLLDLTEGCPCFSFTSCQKGVGVIAWVPVSPPGVTPVVKRVFTGLADGRVAWQDIRIENGSVQASEPHIEVGHKNAAVTSFAFMPDMRSVVSVGADNTVRVWPSDPEDVSYIIRGHRGAIPSVLCFPRNVIVTASRDRSICVWNLSSSSKPRAVHTAARRGSNGATESPSLSRSASNWMRKRLSMRAPTTSLPQTAQPQASPSVQIVLPPPSPTQQSQSLPQQPITPPPLPSLSPKSPVLPEDPDASDDCAKHKHHSSHSLHNPH